ncbi:MAG: hypothetical protein JXB46_08465 [Candidatus Eisenbacteria bacterium]|nr:hypothetical protein [Candidatus Eisenbacteria bacterium]
MARVRLIHWKAEEARERMAQLRAAGHRVRWQPIDPAALRALKASPPDVFVIDLSRMPSQGRDIGVGLRMSARTRRVPLVFVGGQREKVAGVKEILPDALFTTWDRLGPTLSKALGRPAKEPFVPESAFAAYAGKPLREKLGIKPGSTVALVSAPDRFEESLGNMPEGARLTRDHTRSHDLTLWFVRTMSELSGEVRKMRRYAGRDGLWILWPKRTSRLASDLSQSVVREKGLGAGLVDYKICSVDSDWSALKFTERKKRRDGS